MKYFLCLLVSLLSIISSAQAATVEVVFNGGFESGNVGFTSEFTDQSPGLAFQPGERSTTDPVTDYFGVDAFEGDWMLAAVTNNQFVDLTLWSQEVWLEAGVSYDFFYYMARAIGAGEIALSNRINGAEFSTFIADPAEDIWGGRFTSLGVATSGTYTLSLVDVSSTAGLPYAIDNISLNYETLDAEVPLPAGGVLFVTGLMGLAALRRRTGRVSGTKTEA